MDINREDVSSSKEFLIQKQKLRSEFKRNNTESPQRYPDSKKEDLAQHNQPFCKLATITEVPINLRQEMKVTDVGFAINSQNQKLNIEKHSHLEVNLKENVTERSKDMPLKIFYNSSNETQSTKNFIGTKVKIDSQIPSSNQLFQADIIDESHNFFQSQPKTVHKKSHKKNNKYKQHTALSFTFDVSESQNLPSKIRSSRQNKQYNLAQEKQDKDIDIESQKTKPQKRLVATQSEEKFYSRMKASEASVYSSYPLYLNNQLNKNEQKEKVDQQNITVDHFETMDFSKFSKKLYSKTRGRKVKYSQDNSLESQRSQTVKSMYTSKQIKSPATMKQITTQIYKKESQRFKQPTQSTKINRLQSQSIDTQNFSSVIKEIDLNMDEQIERSFDKEGFKFSNNEQFSKRKDSKVDQKQDLMQRQQT